MRRLIILITLLTMLVVFSVNLSAAMAGNESDFAYCGGLSGNPCPPSLAKKKATKTNTRDLSGPTIRELIIEGGGYLYKSCSEINSFFNSIELAELTGSDLKILQQSLNGAIYNMENARATYLQLISTARATPYNPEVISRLINYDYENFQKSNSCFPPVFSKVKYFLSSGDVTGMYDEFYSYTGQILDILYQLKRKITSGQLPNLPLVWIANQKYSEFKLFGQYVAQVFYSIK